MRSFFKNALVPPTPILLESAQTSSRQQSSESRQNERADDVETR